MEVESEKSSVREICSKVKKLKLTDVFQLNLAIDQLNALNCSDFSEENKEYEELLYTLSNLIPSGNDHMLSKFCCLIKLSLQKRKIILHNSSFECLLKMMISAVHSSAEWVLNDVLQTISALFETNVEQVTNFCDDLIGKNGALTKFLLPSNHDKSIIFDAYQCLLSLIKNLCKNGYQGEAFDFCFQKCFLVIKDKFMCSVTDIMILKIVLSSLKCLQYAFVSKNLKIENFGELLGTLKNFLFYGLPGQTFTSDINLYPTLRYPPDGPHNQESQSESDSPHPKLRKQKKSKKRLKKASNKRQFHNEPEVDEGSDYMATDLCENLASVSLSSSSKIISETKGRNSSSDSEISDAENYISQLKPLQVAIRRNAYLALLNVIKITDKKVMFGYWSYFLPEHPVIPGLISSPNIFTSVLKDPAPRVRLNALSLLAEMLRGSKQFLMHADGRNARHTSFTSLSSILATMISEIHRYLLLALVSENSSLILTQILKCYAVLAENVPYSKLDRKIILKFLVHIKSYLFHKDLHVRVACIAVFCSVVNSDQTPAEIEDLMLLSDFENTVDVLNASLQNNVNPSQTSMFPTSEESPWIVKICDNNIRGDEPMPIKIQSLLLLSSIAGKYFQKSLSFFKVLDNIVVVSLSHPDKSVQLHGAKLLDMLGRSMNIVTDMDFKKKFQPLMSAMWQNILKDALIKCLANDVKILRPVCCDCLSTLPSKDFEELPHKLQIAYITILLGLASDSNPNVRGAAIRCLGLFCLFPSLTEDSCFLDDVSDILVKSVEDPNVNVRFKASWSLGNLSDALFLNKDKFLFNKEISSKFFYSMGMACVQFSKDCDRVKANAVRALGNLLNYIPVEFIDLKMMQEFIKESCEVLTSALSSNFMKVCWNSCYALGNMFRNTYLIENSALNLEEVYSCLLKVLKSSNFKVRISAAQALTTLTSRKFYGKLLPVIWHELLSALFSTSLDVNFKEIKHQENLRDQLCLSLCQLAILITSDDMTTIKNETLETQEILLISMWKFGSRMSEEKGTILRDAIDNVTSLTATIASNDVDPGVVVLLDILNQASIAFYSQEGS